MEQTDEEFFHDFRQELLAGAEANGSFQLSEFMETIANDLVETGFTEGFELCHFRAQRGMRVDGYWFNDEGVLDLFIADFDSRNELASLTRTEVAAAFKRVANFFEASANKGLVGELEVTSPEYGLARQIADRKDAIRQVNLVLFSERTLSEKIQALPDTEVAGVPAAHHIWDVSRLHRQRSSRSHKEPLDLDFQQMFGRGIACLSAHLETDTYQSYLMVMPADVIATLYEKFGARLLEQNVRTFLQARGNVNKGIRTTILNEPRMFFAYNNGITATAQNVETTITDSGMTITRVIDLQIVNGGQTTASLFHTKMRDKADLSQIFVQVKLSVIDSQQSEMVVPKISEYANTQNRVNAADFFSNHPFHVRMEGFSRRIWAPAQKGSARETRWFYERARGQYADAQVNLSAGEQRRFKVEHPKLQMFTKTDLAKFENVWDDQPKWVNLGAQKNFARYAARIGKEWEHSSDKFNEYYYRCAIARAIIFRRVEKLVSEQVWYNGGYRANIVAYTISVISECCKRQKKFPDYEKIWKTQAIYSSFEKAIVNVARFVNDEITSPPQGISNISEWCKKESCWTRMQSRIHEVEKTLSSSFFNELILAEHHKNNGETAKSVQQIDKGIEAQKKVFSIPAREWMLIMEKLKAKNILSKKELEILQLASQLPNKVPSEKQCEILIKILEKAHELGVRL